MYTMKFAFLLCHRVSMLHSVLLGNAMQPDVTVPSPHGFAIQYWGKWNALNQHS